MLSQDFDFAFHDLGEKVLVNGRPLNAIVDHAGEDAFGGRFFSGDLMLTMGKAEADTLTEDNQVEIRGKQYAVKKIEPIDDGLFALVHVGEV